MRKLLASAVGAAMLALAFNAHALTITAGTTTAFRTGTETSQSVIEGIIQTAYGPLAGLYKYDFPDKDPAKESGSFASSYTTTFGDSVLVDEDFTITYDGPPAINADPVYLLVKDGNATPAWYLYDISGWNGTDTIQGQNFWPDNGGISHVSIYGNQTSVPDGGTTVLLLGAAMSVLGFVNRKLCKA